MPLHSDQGVTDGNPHVIALDLGTSSPAELSHIYGPFGSSPDLSY
ncbi:MAG: hypothetical protein WBM40_12695 [Thiohalocapsa sp.]